MGVLFLGLPPQNLTRVRLLIASQLDPLSVLEKLEPYLAGSSSIVVYSSSVQVRSLMIVDNVTSSGILQVVAELQSALRDKPQYLGPTVSEAWLRQYQVCCLLINSDRERERYLRFCPDGRIRP
jgi:hypothetical protein